MDKRKLSIRVLVLIFFILLFNYAAMHFHWYSLLFWMDMLMHFLGGAWLALAAVWFLSSHLGGKISIPRVLAGVLLISVLWEVFEIAVDISVGTYAIDWRDTVSDLFFDMSGASVALIYILKRIMRKPEDRV